MAKPNSISHLESKVKMLKEKKANPRDEMKFTLEDGKAMLEDYEEMRRLVEHLKVVVMEKNIEVKRLKKRNDYLWNVYLEQKGSNRKLMRKIQEQADDIKQYADTLTAFRHELLKCKEL